MPNPASEVHSEYMIVITMEDADAFLQQISGFGVIPKAHDFEPHIPILLQTQQHHAARTHRQAGTIPSAS